MLMFFVFKHLDEKAFHHEVDLDVDGAFLFIGIESAYTCKALANGVETPYSCV